MNNENTPNEAQNKIAATALDFESFVNQAKEKISKQTSTVEAQFEAIAAIETDAKRSKEQLLQIQKEFEDTESCLTEAHDLLEKAKEMHEAIEVAYKGALTSHKNIVATAGEILGKNIKKEDGTIERINGLKDQLEESFEELEESIRALSEENESHHQEFKARVDESLKIQSDKNQQLLTNWDNSHQELTKKIKDLLPDALTAGLSYAYEKKRINEEAELNKNQKTFQRTIYVLAIMALIPVVVNAIRYFSHHVPLDAVIESSPSLIMLILPLYLPIVWLAYSSGLKVKLAKRLIEEYAHKETVAKTFEGLSKQIESFADEDIALDLKTKLLFNLLDISAENPGKLITDYNKSDHPVMDALDKSVKFADSLDKLAKVPGFRKLAAKLSESLDKKREEQEIKANAIIEDAKTPN